jgi:hypothetical protein
VNTKTSCRLLALSMLTLALLAARPGQAYQDIVSPLGEPPNEARIEAGDVHFGPVARAGVGTPYLDEPQSAAERLRNGDFELGPVDWTVEANSGTGYRNLVIEDGELPHPGHSACDGHWLTWFGSLADVPSRASLYQDFTVPRGTTDGSLRMCVMIEPTPMRGAERVPPQDNLQVELIDMSLAGSAPVVRRINAQSVPNTALFTWVEARLALKFQNITADMPMRLRLNGSTVPDGWTTVLHVDGLSLTTSGQAAPPDITVSPASIDFGLARVGQRVQRELLIGNLGMADLLINSLSIRGSASSAFDLCGLTPSGFTLRSWEARRIPVCFTPRAAGSFWGVLAIRSNDPDEGEVLIPLSGRTSTPDIEVSPLNLSMGVVPVGQKGWRLLRISNVGDGPLFVRSLAMRSGAGSAFNLCDLVPSGFSLEPGGAYLLVVCFQPRTPGVYNDVLEVRSDDPDEPLVAVNLTGRTGWPRIQVTPLVLDFVTGATQQVKLSNVGQIDLVVTGITVRGGAASSFRLCPGVGPLTLAAGASRVVEVCFTPLAGGASFDRLSVQSNDPVRPEVNVQLRPPHALSLNLITVDLYHVTPNGTVGWVPGGASVAGNSITLKPNPGGGGHVQVLRIEFEGVDESPRHAFDNADVVLSTNIDPFRGGGWTAGDPNGYWMDPANLAALARLMGPGGHLNRGGFIYQRISPARTRGVVWWGLGGLSGRVTQLSIRARCSDGHARAEAVYTISAP